MQRLRRHLNCRHMLDVRCQEKLKLEFCTLQRQTLAADAQLCMLPEAKEGWWCSSSESSTIQLAGKLDSPLWRQPWAGQDGQRWSSLPGEGRCLGRPASSSINWKRCHLDLECHIPRDLPGNSLQSCSHETLQAAIPLRKCLPVFSSLLWLWYDSFLSRYCKWESWAHKYNVMP